MVQKGVNGRYRLETREVSQKSEVGFPDEGFWPRAGTGILIFGVNWPLGQFGPVWSFLARKGTFGQVGPIRCLISPPWLQETAQNSSKQLFWQFWAKLANSMLNLPLASQNWPKLAKRASSGPIRCLISPLARTCMCPLYPCPHPWYPPQETPVRHLLGLFSGPFLDQFWPGTGQALP